MVRLTRFSVFLVFLISALTACNYETFEGTATANARLTVQWDRPVERENNEPLFLYEIGGYELSYRAVGDIEYQTLVITNGSTTETELSNIKSGQYEIRIAAFDTNGLYSRYSDSVILTAQ